MSNSNFGSSISFESIIKFGIAFNSESFIYSEISYSFRISINFGSSMYNGFSNKRQNFYKFHNFCKFQEFYKLEGFCKIKEKYTFWEIYDPQNFTKSWCSGSPKNFINS